MTPNPLCQGCFTAGPSICGREEARRRGDAELAPITSACLVRGSLNRVALGVSLQQARQALSRSLRSPGRPGPGSGAGAPHCRCTPCEEAEALETSRKRSLRMTPCKKCFRKRLSPTVGSSMSRPSRCWPDPGSPTTRSAAVLLGALGVNTSEVRRRLDAVTPES